MRRLRCALRGLLGHDVDEVLIEEVTIDDYFDTVPRTSAELPADGPMAPGPSSPVAAVGPHTSGPTPPGLESVRSTATPLGSATDHTISDSELYGLAAHYLEYLSTYLVSGGSSVAPGAREYLVEGLCPILRDRAAQFAAGELSDSN